MARFSLFTQAVNESYMHVTRVAPGENEKRGVLVNAQVAFAENDACRITEHLPNLLAAISIADKGHVALTSVPFIWYL